MIKSATVWGFLLALALAVGVFFGRDRSTPLEALKSSSDRSARVRLEDFVFYRYKGQAVNANFSAKLGLFYEPNIVEMHGNLHGEQYRRGKLETLRSEIGHAIFSSNSLNALMRDGTLVRAYVEDNVIMELDGNLLKTEQAEYIASRQILRSHRAIRVIGPSRVFDGDDGFTYDVDREVLTMSGLIQGVVSGQPRY